MSAAEPVRTVHDAALFGRVAVLYGGASSEREVSLRSGAAVLAALREAGVEASGWDPAERNFSEFLAAGFDRVWIALHGPGGEDGTVQGALEWAGMPYTGSGVMASALAMDKVRSKMLFSAAGLATPAWQTVRSRTGLEQALAGLDLPLIVKPAGQGSSVGMYRVESAAELEAAWAAAAEYDDPVIVEEWVDGGEYTVAVLQGAALPSIRIETPRRFYDYAAKYESADTLYHCPGTDEPALEQELHRLALAAFAALGCRGWGRVDFMVGADRVPQLLEINTVPGMTGQSLVPMAAARAGIDFSTLCWRILETSVTELPAVATRRSANGA
ncbi:MAG TPA: D-alanine--D-alanine ligase [Woeseiaceae bacterium]|nr:D-alanine--D-alanine ligase [Woeseiaceae bacterium]